MARDRVTDAENSLEKIKRQLSSGAGRSLLQGPLLKRSETLRKWNERWVTLDPATGKMEYRTRRNELTTKGTIIFDANSTITLSPVNVHGLPKYDGCCFYIGTPQKKEYFLCAETPGAAKAWVSTLRASQLVLKAHREAVNSLGGNGSTIMGTVAAAVAAANSTAKEAAKEIEAAMQISMKAALGALTNQANDKQMDNMTIMKETLRVKDEELHQLARELRARDATIKDIADKLSQTAEAAEAAASAAHAMDNERKTAVTELQRLTKDSNERIRSMTLKLKDLEDKVAVLNKERENLLNQRDSASQEAHLWRGELAKARERAVIMEAALVRAEERSKYLEADTEAKVTDAIEKQLEAMKARDDALKEVSRLKSALQRLHSEAKVKELIMNQNVQENLPVGTGNAEEAPETYKLDKITDANASKEAVHSTGKELVYIDENHQLGSSSSMLPQKENDSIITVVNVQSAPPSCLSSTEPQDLDATLEEPDSSQSREPEDRH
eukprot:TRINITY_DN2482_c0_g1_i2.p1 TRINITY_DN2482_c0_g1~~TRINITY_DN2482_c0_g1_i2.p1  ORF type:complete len:531 (-),score=150.81 TRINITY_DN2482_c0_g1_i2:306-1799(-)